LNTLLAPYRPYQLSLCVTPDNPGVMLGQAGAGRFGISKYSSLLIKNVEA
jgi:hypothetical protein